MSGPQRIQLRRTKGWRKPEGAIVVARPSKWGNPYRVGSLLDIGEIVKHRDGGHIREFVALVPCDAALAVALYGAHVKATFGLDTIRAELAGHDLACWCPLDQPCHADVLLELANGGR
jgi:hypothetical protein